MSDISTRDHKNKDRVPELRFSEFSGSWQLKNIGDIFSYQKTNSLSRSQLSTVGSVDNIHYGDIHMKLPSHLDLRQISLPKIIANTSFSDEEWIRAGDIVMADASEDYNDIGKSVEIISISGKDKAVAGLHTLLMRPKKELGAGFVGFSLQTNAVRMQLKKLATGVSVLGLSKSSVSQVDIYLPSLPEQQKIASFLATVDTRIEKLEQKITLLKAYKKGVMQKIFSQEVRFRDENDGEYPEWEENRLGEVGRIVTGKTPDTSDSSKWVGDVLFVTPTDIKEGKYQHTTKRTVATLSDGVLPAKSIMYTCIASIGKMALSTEPTITNQQINSLVPKADFDNEFVYYGLLRLTPRIISTQSSNTLPIINKTEFSKFKLPTPSFKEQQKIAIFLSSLDDRMVFEEDRLEGAKKFKKSLLQKMFV